MSYKQEDTLHDCLLILVTFNFHYIRNHHHSIHHIDLLSCHDDCHNHNPDVYHFPNGNFSCSYDIVMHNDLHNLDDEVDMVLVDMDVEGMVLVDMVLDDRYSDIHNDVYWMHKSSCFHRNYSDSHSLVLQHMVIHFDFD